MSRLTIVANETSTVEQFLRLISSNEQRLVYIQDSQDVDRARNMRARVCARARIRRRN